MVLPASLGTLAVEPSLSEATLSKSARYTARRAQLRSYSWTNSATTESNADSSIHGEALNFIGGHEPQKIYRLTS